MNNNNCFNEELKPQFDMAKNKKHITTIFFFLFSLLTISTVLQLVGDELLTKFFPTFTEHFFYIWFLSIVPLYFFALPASSPLILKAEKTRIIPSTEKFKLLHIIGFLGVAVIFMYIGSIVSNLITYLITQLTNKPINNTVSQLLSNTPWWMGFFATVIVAPFGEEFIFRKLLIDRVNVYGQKFAILFSAIIFSLFHTNIYQMFYTFLLGAIFSYVYVKTGKLRYSIFLHASINFIGGVAAPYIVSVLEDAGFFEAVNLPQEELIEFVSANLNVVLLAMVFVAVIFMFVISGIVFVLTQYKNFSLEKGKIQIPRTDIGYCLFYNAGAVLFILVSSVLLVLKCI